MKLWLWVAVGVWMWMAELGTIEAGGELSLGIVEIREAREWE